ncbi:MAG: hypothetical protein HZA52_07710 [Planctomycetes bacterium]|nr:hypothetical protein [Planctomycetota bacterium]
MIARPLRRTCLRLLLLLGALTLGASEARTETLQAALEAAGPAHGFDRWVELTPGARYTGGLWIGATFDRLSGTFRGRGEDVRIVGNGAILDLEGGSLCIAYCANRLELEDCVVVHGSVVYRGYHDAFVDLRPRGLVRYVTFWEPHDYAVRLFACGVGITLERNLAVDAIDTGPDFMYLTGEQNRWLPTGASFSHSVQDGHHDFFDNWSFHSDPSANADMRRHFHGLCDYG